MKNKILLTIIVLFTSILSFAQTTKVSGKIIDEKNSTSIEYATIRVLKNNVVAISNSNGEFTLNAEIGDKIEVSHISYKSINTNLQNQITIPLQLTQIELNEIIVAANPLQDISQSVVINDTEKRISQPRSVGHLFKDISGFGIAKKGAYASEPVFRSFKYEQLNVQYEGGLKLLTR